MSLPAMKHAPALRLARQRHGQLMDAHAAAVELLELVRAAADYCDRSIADRYDDLTAQASHLSAGIASLMAHVQPPPAFAPEQKPDDWDEDHDPEDDEPEVDQEAEDREWLIEQAGIGWELSQ